MSGAASSSISPFLQLVYRRLCHKVVRTPVLFCQRVVTGIRRFHLSRRWLRRVHLDVRDPFQNPRCTTQLLRCLSNLRIGVFARNRRLGFTCVRLSLSPSLAVVGSGGIEGALVPADDDPSARCVSPACVQCQFRRCTTANQTLSVPRQSFHEFQQRDICALVWRKPGDSSCNLSSSVSDDDVRIVFVQSSFQTPLSQPLSPP